MHPEKTKEVIFANGDKVFAKVKGYPAWPAFILRQEKFGNKIKYHVIFYSTNENACLSPEDIYPYEANKEKYGKPGKRAAFNQALEEIKRDTPDLAKYLLAEKMSAAQADVEEIQKKSRKLDPEDVAASGTGKKNKILKVTSDMSANSSHKAAMKGKKANSVGLANKNIHTKASHNTSDVGGTKGVGGNMSAKKIRQIVKPTAPIFQAKTVHGENPYVHLQKMNIFGISDSGTIQLTSTEKPDGGNTVTHDTVTSELDNGEKVDEGSKKEASVILPERNPVKRKVRIEKENEKAAIALAKQLTAKENKAAAKPVSTVRRNRPKFQTEVTNFDRGDHVFAKVKGYAAWPAVVTSHVADDPRSYHVAFYACDMRGVCKVQQIFPYEQYREIYGVPHKRNSSFNMALVFIKKAASGKKAAAAKRAAGGQASGSGGPASKGNSRKNNRVNNNLYTGNSVYDKKSNAVLVNQPASVTGEALGDK